MSKEVVRVGGGGGGVQVLEESDCNALNHGCEVGLLTVKGSLETCGRGVS